MYLKMIGQSGVLNTYQGQSGLLYSLRFVVQIGFRSHTEQKIRKRKIIAYNLSISLVPFLASAVRSKLEIISTIYINLFYS